MKLDYEPINKDGDVDLYLSVNDKFLEVLGGIGYNSQDKIIGSLVFTIIIYLEITGQVG